METWRPRGGAQPSSASSVSRSPCFHPGQYKRALPRYKPARLWKTGRLRKGIPLPIVSIVVVGLSPLVQGKAELETYLASDGLGLRPQAWGGFGLSPWSVPKVTRGRKGSERRAFLLPSPVSVPNCLWVLQSCHLLGEEDSGRIFKRSFTQTWELPCKTVNGPSSCQSQERRLPLPLTSPISLPRHASPSKRNLRGDGPLPFSPAIYSKPSQV